MNKPINNTVMSKLLLVFFLLSFKSVSYGDMIKWRDYEIHFTSLSSMHIPKSVAAAHNITRSEQRIVTNITIRQNGKAVRSEISGTNQNLLGQIFTLSFDEVREPNAIYYLSNQLIDERDTLIFKLKVKPATLEDAADTLLKDAAGAFEFTFTRQY